MRARIHALALAAFVLAACGAGAGCALGPPPTHALVVRHPERKCALIAFSGCASLVPEPALDELDAGVDDP